jgi:uncharacterized membrane protein
MTKANEQENIFSKMRPLHRVGISLFAAALTFVVIIKSDIYPLLRLMIVWDVFALTYIVTCWIVFFKRSTLQIRNVARQEDGSRVFVLSVLMLASLASMVAVLVLILSKDAQQESFYMPGAIAGMLLSWLIVHTTFAFHYAHLYYNDDKQNPQKHAEGLCFPNEKAPDYLDFAYFSFVLGMTFQVSDVEISARVIRRVALVHGLLSFGLNTFVVALTINIIAGLKH